MQGNNGMFYWPVRVYYEDTDAGGVVYHSNYMNFMERGRTEMLRARGFEQDKLRAEQGLIFAVRSAAVEFIKSARFNEQLMVTTEIVEQNRIAITFNQTIIKLPEGKDGPDDALAASPDSTVMCSGLIKVVSLDANTMKPKRMPASLLKEIVSGE